MYRVNRHLSNIIQELLTKPVEIFHNNDKYLPAKSIPLQQFLRGKNIEAFTFHKLFKRMKKIDIKDIEIAQNHMLVVVVCTHIKLLFQQRTKLQIYSTLLPPTSIKCLNFIFVYKLIYLLYSKQFSIHQVYFNMEIRFVEL